MTTPGATSHGLPPDNSLQNHSHYRRGRRAGLWVSLSSRTVLPELRMTSRALPTTAVFLVVWAGLLCLGTPAAAYKIQLTEDGDCPINTVRTLDGDACISCATCYTEYSPQDWLCLNCTRGGRPFLGDEQKLYEDLFLKKPLYNRHLRPLRNHSDQLLVYFTLKIKQIVDIDERDQILKLNIIIKQSWKDIWLQWNPKEYGGLEELRVPAFDVWLPDTTLYNTADTNSAYAGTTGTNVVLRHDGLVRMETKPFIQRSTCEIKIRYFPFDEQKCKLKFGLWTYDWYLVDLYNSTAGPDMGLYLENEQWDMSYTCFKRHLVDYVCCPVKYVDVTLYVGLRRKPLYYMYKLVMPIVLLSALSMVGFLMPYNVGVVKANLSITLILSMTVFLLLVAETIPKTSEGLPLISEYYLIIMFLIAISTAMNITVLNIFHRGEDGTRQVPSWLRTLVLKYVAKVMCMDCKGEYLLQRRSDPKLDQARLAMLRKQRWFNARYATSYSPLISETYRNDITSAGHQSNGHGNPEAELDHFVDHLGESDEVRLTKLESNVHGILRQIRAVQRRTDGNNRVHTEWALVATVTDRLLFYIYACFTVSMSVIVLLVNPAFNGNKSDSVCGEEPT
ncbi:neuronal acetylcholine receptor subunit alpha-10-like [Acanthaster planci]|uniref:Neuronal acetylcholine receptor subunit alpha-10-like n=1 Tax=Acanthaster planci TaxID=133434 RepID=A0A8B7YTY2_ACAPL|nr:neuronal acetylcholine receptor subunit alpha-10-like [Acanthaster planci]XP_022094795.1 neuronal acetylcholine receptor subunit alpha-10-like [Acanthaster planci]XP_022094796.1 neuronal acetylcholine receptor subunit alpha-10-like [Acanthaster planci]XP_022094797.1 neuronal acetylcholine receptor subunit alpha-10-like [Acanthaster planci]XP_022094799.1 neuronal acetylcholine receptor subunit alpha-10-like [Acanthaster planci]XP_022094800.1 neuronal acetylcholine receptor subunit alpha-10-l